MSDTRIILVAVAVVLAAAVIASGCVQNNGTQAQSPNGPVTTGPGSPPRYSGQRFQPNLTAAAEKLGVSEQDLETALNTTFQGRMNLTGAAQRLGVTTQELADALGFHFNASMPRGTYRPTQG